MKEQKEIFRFEKNFPAISSSFFDRNNDNFFTGHSNGEVIYWKKISIPNDYKMICKLNGEVTSLDKINENTILICSNEGEVIIYNLNENEIEIIEPATFGREYRKWRVLKLSDNSFLTSGNYGKLYYWIKKDDKWEKNDINPYGDTAFGLRKLGNNIFVSGDYKGRLIIWKLENGNPIVLQEIFLDYNIKQVDGFDNNLLVVLGRDGSFSILEKDTNTNEFKVSRKFNVSFGIGMDIIFSENGQHVIVGTDSQLLLYDLKLDLIKKIDIMGCVNLFTFNGGIFLLTVDSLKFIDLSSIDIEVEKIDFKYQKISLIGDSGVGKSTLCNTITGSVESKIYSTVGKKTWKWELPVQKDEKYSKRIYFQDLGGQKTALSTLLHYTLDSDIILVVFKQTIQETLNNALEIVRKIKEINKEIKIVLIQTHSDHKENNDVEFIDFNNICKDYGIIAYATCTSDDPESVEPIIKKILSLIDWDNSTIFVQSRAISDILNVITELKSLKNVSSIDFADFKDILSKKIDITALHLKYILIYLNDQGIIEYFPDILNKVILNEEEYNKLKMRIPRWAKEKRGIFVFSELVNALSNGNELKKKYIEIIDQLHQSYNYSIKIGNKRIYPTSYYLSEDNIKIPIEFKFNKEQKLTWEIEIDTFPLLDLLDQFQESGYYCYNISQKSGLFYLLNNSVYFYYFFEKLRSVNTSQNQKNKFKFEMYYNGTSNALFSTFLKNFEKIMTFLFNSKIKIISSNTNTHQVKEKSNKKSFNNNFIIKKQNQIKVKKQSKIDEDNNNQENNESNISFKEIYKHSNVINLEENVDISNNTTIPTVFISYSHDNNEYEKWVKDFGIKLIQEARINAILDQWDLNFGNLLSKFMEKIKEVDKIIIILSPLYKKKADEYNNGGVPYEKRLIVEEIFRGNSQKIIPITPFNYRDVMPYFLSDTFIAEFTDINYDKIFKQIVLNIYGKPRERKPELGNLPDYV